MNRFLLILLAGVLTSLASANGQGQDSTQFIRQGQEVLHSSSRGNRTISYFEYARKRYLDPRRRTVFTEKVLIPLVTSKGDSAARASLTRYRAARNKNALLGGVWLTGSVVGIVISFNQVGELVSSLSGSSSQSVQTQRSQGAAALVSTVVAWSCGFAYVLTAHRPKQYLYQTVEAYNQSRRPRVSWQIASMGTGLQLVGHF